MIGKLSCVVFALLAIAIFICIATCPNILDPNDKVCEIEYMDGERETIECFHAGSASCALKIYIFGEDDVVKSLATIKRWKLKKKEVPRKETAND